MSTLTGTSLTLIRLKYGHCVVRRSYRSSRRDQAAAETRGAILDAAERLFSANGYARTTVAQVAEAAAVATNTVYTSIGGKPQLVLALAERGVSDPTIMRTLDDVEAATDTAQVLRALAHGTAETSRRQFQVITVLYDNVHADPLIADAARRTDVLYRERLDRAAHRLAEFGALRPDVDIAAASDVLWFYFGRIAWRQLHDLGWSGQRIERWLVAQATAALCGPG